MNTLYTMIESPVGDLLLTGQVATGGGVTLTSLSMPGQRNAPAIQANWVRRPELFAEAAAQLAAYFAGERQQFDLDFAPTGTEFQHRVWDALDAIPYGSTTTYGALARHLGVPRDRVQAVGAAIGANPLLILRPCHRVIGADGKMRGYAGGVERKQQLLIHEGALQPVLV
jgi:methylated-DNA-[protein]-cysteine S-methyltransferase